MNPEPQKLDRVFFALSDSTRRGILAQLANGSSTIGELSRPYDISAPAISKHMRILEQAGLIQREKCGRQHHCTLATKNLQSAEDWINFHRNFWESRIDSLEEMLRTQNSKN
jgi:DNA-binding transcriptional ArsR family regulator